MKYTTGQTFVSFDRLMDRTATALRGRVRGALGYAAPVLIDRVVQRVVELGLPPFAREVSARMSRGEMPVPSDDTVLDCGDLRLHVGSGRIHIPARRALRHHVDFAAHWGYCLAAILGGVASRGIGDAAALIHDLSESDILTDGTDENFVAFCRSGPVTPLRTSPRLLVAAPATMAPSTQPSTVAYCRHPLVTLAREARLGVIGRLRLLAWHLALPVRYALAVAATPELSLLGREAAYRELAAAVDREGALTAVFHTCSSYRSQPLWVRGLSRARSHMVWYAQNWKPTRKLSDDVDADYPTTRWIRSDVHWVWTESFARYLGGLVPAEIVAVGPLLWRLPPSVGEISRSHEILVFDVPAVSDRVMLEANGEVSNYFAPENVQSFLDDVVALGETLSAERGEALAVTLKMKRGYRPDYARTYYEYVDRLVADGVVGLASAESNLFEIIGESRLVIAYPFTSPAYVAEYMSVPAIYYDPTGTVQQHDFSDRRGAVGFARDRSGLQQMASAALRQSGTVGHI